MKKPVILTIIALLAAISAYLLFFRKAPSPPEVKDQPLHIGKNTAAFDNAFSGLLDAYYSLRDALVEWDTVAADRQANAVIQRADSLPFKELKADSAIVLTAQSLAAMVSGEAKGFVGETGIEPKRREFNTLTNGMYDLVRTVHYGGDPIYHIRCPMAFGDSAEGFWLSNTSKIVNPYLGKKHPTFGAKMLGCGEVTDSLDWTK
ncbi:MAG: DUF3347 domain-containing protein [Bacteroidota bacterium]|nr:DUF3347 domain-containing protein [Bacteroidota bacterium]MDP4216742.1 DUF3347 domain-containing protein [Bacteroidota bacterium]MDP4247100.1 DUF3347 domain-containing protein [Bacteroidota bacterium]MDP4255834.1 DUF3347 domain-containing protein [Bacteroidota bacterium]MDP4259103.1 DUF3347 domain-containing protein [Bacteroidota bacterium]